LITYSVMTQHALEAAQVLLEEHSVDAEVVDLRTLVPLDIDSVLRSVAKTRRAVVCHEAWTFGGFGAEIASQINEHLFGELAAPVLRVGAQSAPIAFSPPLERALVPEASEVVQAVLRTVKP
jgi:pyruvate dehydrogenase E1 component beta subunit